MENMLLTCLPIVLFGIKALFYDIFEDSFIWNVLYFLKFGCDWLDKTITKSASSCSLWSSLQRAWLPLQCRLSCLSLAAVALRFVSSLCSLLWSDFSLFFNNQQSKGRKRFSQMVWTREGKALQHLFDNKRGAFSPSTLRNTPRHEDIPDVCARRSHLSLLLLTLRFLPL